MHRLTVFKLLNDADSLEDSERRLAESEAYRAGGDETIANQRRRILQLADKVESAERRLASVASILDEMDARLGNGSTVTHQQILRLLAAAKEGV